MVSKYLLSNIWTKANQAQLQNFLLFYDCWGPNLGPGFYICFPRIKYWCIDMEAYFCWLRAAFHILRQHMFPSFVITMHTCVSKATTVPHSAGAKEQRIVLHKAARHGWANWRDSLAPCTVPSVRGWREPEVLLETAGSRQSLEHQEQNQHVHIEERSRTAQLWLVHRLCLRRFVLWLEILSIPCN